MAASTEIVLTHKEARQSARHVLGGAAENLRACGLILLIVAVLGPSLLWNAPNAWAQSTGAVWGTPVTVDATGDVGEFTSLAGSSEAADLLDERPSGAHARE